METTVLITGSSGFLGRHITEAFRSNGHTIIAPTSAELDITHEDSIQKAVERYRPNIFANFACITGYLNCSTNPDRAWDVNVRGVATIARLCREHSIVLIQPSSASVFDGEKKEPYKENDPIAAPKNISGQTKYAAEQIALSAGVQLIMPRITTTYGPIQKGDTTNILKTIVEQLQHERKTYPLFDDQYANVVAVDEVGDAVATLAEKKIRGTVHLGGPEKLSIWEFGNLVKATSVLNGEIPKGSTNETDYPPNMVLDTTHAQSVGIRFSSPVEKLPAWTHFCSMDRRTRSMPSA